MGQVLRLHASVHRDGRERFWLFDYWTDKPAGYLSGDKYLYAFGHQDGRVKIGVAVSPRARMCHHWANTGNAITWAHLFGRHKNPEQIERRACKLANEVGVRIRRTEWFTNLSRDQALRCVRQAIQEAI